MRRMALTFRKFFIKNRYAVSAKADASYYFIALEKNFLLKTDTPYLGEKMRRIELIKRVVFLKIKSNTPYLRDQMRRIV